VLLGCLFLCELWRPNTLQGLACNSSVSLKVHMCQAHWTGSFAVLPLGVILILSILMDGITILFSQRLNLSTN
jgi:hypothetical protein